MDKESPTFRLRLTLGIILSIIAAGLAVWLISIYLSLRTEDSRGLPISSNNETRDVPTPKVSVDFTSLRKGAISTLTKREDVEITTSSDLERYWSQLGESQVLPAVDFSTEEVLLVAMGGNNSGGYDIEITNIYQYSDNNIEVIVSEISPKPGDLVTQILTRPFHLVKIKKPTGQVTFIHQ